MEPSVLESLISLALWQQDCKADNFIKHRLLSTYHHFSPLAVLSFLFKSYFTPSRELAVVQDSVVQSCVNGKAYKTLQAGLIRYCICHYAINFMEFCWVTQSEIADLMLWGRRTENTEAYLFFCLFFFSVCLFWKTVKCICLWLKPVCSAICNRQCHVILIIKLGREEEFVKWTGTPALNSGIQRFFWSRKSNPLNNITEIIHLSCYWFCQLQIYRSCHTHIGGKSTDMGLKVKQLLKHNLSICFQRLLKFQTFNFFSH